VKYSILSMFDFYLCHSTIQLTFNYISYFKYPQFLTNIKKSNVNVLLSFISDSNVILFVIAITTDYFNE